MTPNLGCSHRFIHSHLKQTNKPKKPLSLNTYKILILNQALLLGDIESVVNVFIMGSHWRWRVGFEQGSPMTRFML